MCIGLLLSNTTVRVRYGIKKPSEEGKEKGVANKQDQEGAKEDEFEQKFHGGKFDTGLVETKATFETDLRDPSTAVKYSI